MKATGHHCAANGCQREIPPRLLMCITHWRMVPAPMQREVRATYREWLAKAPRASSCAVMPSLIAYRNAVAAAVAAVENKQLAHLAKTNAIDGDLFADPQHNPSQEEHGITNTTEVGSVKRCGRSERAD